MIRSRSEGAELAIHINLARHRQTHPLFLGGVIHGPNSILSHPSDPAEFEFKSVIWALRVTPDRNAPRQCFSILCTSISRLRVASITPARRPQEPGQSRRHRQNILQLAFPNNFGGPAGFA
jgi:hypothetical protein